MKIHGSSFNLPSYILSVSNFSQPNIQIMLALVIVHHNDWQDLATTVVPLNHMINQQNGHDT